MNIRENAVILVLGLSLATGISGALPQDVILETKTFLARDMIHAGETFKAAVRLGIAPSWHINANPVNDDFLIPTTVDIEEDANFRAVKVVYPASRTARFDFSEADAVVYDGNATFGILIEAGTGIAPGTYTLKGSVMYQACNAKSCLAPETIGFELAVVVAASGDKTLEINADIFAAIDFAK